MGGDHKCSVCQATFTRPQHVARHMRSHTGDRPYKCQFCGDQFARSDLLSRHVNKCHPNEKIPQLAGTRRKGSVAACRATTSKQSCDQCVQASLPCDGCNPCATCIQKKCRCTFVKFHRQTAPVGPGHNLTVQPSRTAFPHGDGYAMPGVPSELYHQHLDLLRSGPSEIHVSSTSSAGLDVDVSAKYRTHADFVGRGSIPFHSASQLAPGQLYAEPQVSQHWGEWSQNPLDGFTIPDDARMSRNAMARYLLEDSANIALPRHFTSAEDPNSSMKAPSQNAVFSALAMSGNHFHNLPNSGPSLPRRGSHDRSSDGSHASSAASSSVHLPADMSSLSHQIPYQDLSRDVSSLSNQMNRSPVAQSQNHSSQLNNGPLSLAAPEVFSSAFGLLSIDDPNVLAGLSNDGVPFFSGANLFPDSAGGTSTTLKSANQGSNMIGTHTMATPGTSRELEIRELREFWRAYVRTPFTGPASSETPHLVFTRSRDQTPSGNGPRRARVSSLPSVKTPSVEIAQPQYPPKENAVGNNVISSIRTTLNGRGGEDLRSYEAAVFARKPSFNLNLVPRKGRRDSTASPQVPSAPHGPANYDSPAAPKISINGSSSGPSNSSLVNAFGKQESNGCREVYFAGRQSEDGRLLPGSIVLEQDKLRPSFKRLASQTLGPEFSKRAQLSHGEEEEEEDDGDDDGDFVEYAHMMATNAGHAASRRRMSDPAKRWGRSE